MPNSASGGAEHWRQYRDQAAPDGAEHHGHRGKVDELLSGVEFMKNKMLKYDCDQMLKEMKKDEEKWKREEYKKVWENIKKSNRFGEVGCGGGLQYILVPKDVQVIAMWNGKVSNENSNKK